MSKWPKALIHENENKILKGEFPFLLPDVTNHIKIPALYKCGFAGDWYCMVSNVIDQIGKLKKCIELMCFILVSFIEVHKYIFVLDSPIADIKEIYIFF